MAKLTTTQKKRVGLLAKAIYDFKAKRAGVPKAKADAVFAAYLNNLDTDNSNPRVGDLKAAMLAELSGGKPQAAGDWLAILEKLLPILIQLLPIIFGLFATLLIALVLCVGDAQAQTIPQVVRNSDTVGAFAQVDAGFLAALLTKDRSGVPYVTIHEPVGKTHGTIPPIAIIVEDGKLRVQLSDGKWSTNVPIQDVIKAVKEAQKAKTASIPDDSPFRLTGCPCAGGRCEAPVVVSQPSQPITHSVLAGPVLVEGQPVRNVGRVVVAAPVRVTAWFQEHRPVRRLVAAPFRWMRGCGCR